MLQNLKQSQLINYLNQGVQILWNLRLVIWQNYQKHMVRSTRATFVQGLTFISVMSNEYKIVVV